MLKLVIPVEIDINFVGKNIMLAGGLLGKSQLSSVLLGIFFWKGHYRFELQCKINGGMLLRGMYILPKLLSKIWEVA